MLFDELSAFLRFLAYDDVLWTLQHHAQNGADSRWPGTDYQHCVILLDFGYSCSPEAGCKYVADKQGLLVSDAVRNPIESLVSIWDADEFCLTAVDAASEGPAAVR